nr:translation initiation factor IF-2-like [Taeniopygia guttata]
MLSPISAGPRPASPHGEPAGTHSAPQSGALQQRERRGRPRLQRPPATAAVPRALGWVGRAAAVTGSAGAGPSGPLQGGGAAAPTPRHRSPTLEGERESCDAAALLGCPSAEAGERRARRHHSLYRGRARPGLRPGPPAGSGSPPAGAGWVARLQSCFQRLILPRRGVSASGCCCRRPHAGRRSGAAAGSSRPSPRGGGEPPPGASQRSGSSSRRGTDSPRSRQYGTSSFARLIRSRRRAALIRPQLPRPARPSPASPGGREGRDPRLPPGGDGAGGGDRPSAGERRQLPGENGGGLLPSARPRAVMLAWPRSLVCRRRARSDKPKRARKTAPSPPRKASENLTALEGAAVGGEGPQRSAVAAGEIQLKITERSKSFRNGS